MVVPLVIAECKFRHSLRSTLAARCWSARPDKRPTAIELVGHLESLLADAQASTAKETQVAAAAAAAKAAAQAPDRAKLGRAQQYAQGISRPQFRVEGGGMTPGLEQRPGGGGAAAAQDPRPGAENRAPHMCGVEAAPEPRKMPDSFAVQDAVQSDAEGAQDKVSGGNSGSGDGGDSCAVVGAVDKGGASAICLLPFTNPGMSYKQ